MIELLKMGVIIIGIIALIRLNVRLSITLLGSAVALGFLFNLPWKSIQAALLAAILDPETLKIVAALELVLVFSALMKDRGSMDRAISALRGIFRDARITVAVIPAVIGMLPVVGGAMLSAPLVAAASDELRLTPERRTFLNFWFRHVWEYALPTFPAVFLTAGIVGLPIADLVLINLPLTAASILTGIAFGFKDVQVSAKERTHAAGDFGRNALSFVLNLLPLFLVILLTVCFDIHLAYSMALVTTGVVVLYRISVKRLRQVALRHVSVELAVLICGIMVFKEILMASGAMNRIAAEFAHMGVPVAVLVVVIPALIAFMTGYTTAFVGLSFPVLLPFLNADGAGPYYVMLAMASGICAHLLSPMHACYVMTLQYYQANMAKTYRLLLGPALLTFLTGAAVFMVGRWFSG